MRKGLRDYLLMWAPPLLSGVGFFAFRNTTDTGLLVPIFFGVNFLGQMAIKALFPDHAVLRMFPWWLVVVTVAAVLTASVLFANFYILGWWTPPAIVALLTVVAVSVMIAEENEKKKNR